MKAKTKRTLSTLLAIALALGLYAAKTAIAAM